MNKAMSPNILPKYTKLLKTASKNFQTNMSTKEITSLVKMQLDDMSQWKIKYANATGTGAKKTTFSFRHSPKYVCVPDYSSVEKITKKIKHLLKAAPDSQEEEKDNKDDKDNTKDNTSSQSLPEFN